MPFKSPLHEYVHTSFVKAFGEPHRVADGDTQWSLKPHAFAADLNVLVLTEGEHPVVWTFDPHDPNDGVQHVSITDEGQVEGLIRRIQDRVKYATRPSGKP